MDFAQFSIQWVWIAATLIVSCIVVFNMWKFATEVASKVDFKKGWKDAVGEWASRMLMPALGMVFMIFFVLPIGGLGIAKVMSIATTSTTATTAYELLSSGIAAVGTGATAALSSDTPEVPSLTDTLGNSVSELTGASDGTTIQGILNAAIGGSTGTIGAPAYVPAQKPAAAAAAPVSAPLTVPVFRPNPTAVPVASPFTAAGVQSIWNGGGAPAFGPQPQPTQGPAPKPGGGPLVADADAAVANVGSYTVKPGDSLASISKKVYGTTRWWSDICKANGLSNCSNIKVGTVLTIPQR